MNRYVLLLIAGLMLSGCSRAESDPPVAEAALVEVKLQWHDEFFCIPTPIPPPTNTTAILHPPLQTLHAPDRAVNLALDKPVSSSDNWPIIGDLEQIIDGVKHPFDGSYVELNDGLQWIHIDLGQPSRIYGIATWRPFMVPRVYRDVVVQIADDADFRTNVRTVFNNDHDNSSGLGAGSNLEFLEAAEGHRIQLNGQTARHVRIYSRGNTDDNFNHYIEVEVWGVPAE